MFFDQLYSRMDLCGIIKERNAKKKKPLHTINFFYCKKHASNS